MSGNCIGERMGAKLSCKLAYSREGIPKSPFMPTVVVILALAGKTRNGARFENERDLMVQVFYDPPPHPLTKGQVSRTYCYDSGLVVARLREPLTGGWYYDEREYSKTHSPSPDPYDVSPEAHAPDRRRKRTGSGRAHTPQATAWSRR